ncbi:MAG: sorbosone dehydrogenase family protein [Neptuniibacter sp.]|nr:sorbosone dehydrogenase family protein [Neptuniibacter sp.]
MTEFLLLMAFFNQANGLELEQLQLPDGLKIEVVATAPNVRQLALAQDGTLFAGSRRAGNVYAFIDKDKDGKYEETIEIASGLNLPSGVAVEGNDLYVAEVQRILRYKNILPLKQNIGSQNSQKNLPEPEIYFDELPDKRHHGWKYLKFGPDGALYFNIGAPCNICLPEEPFATLVRLDQQKNLSIIASGVRNSVGFTWHPTTEKIWFTDNGRDFLGDNQPSDELNRLEEYGQHFGYPFIHASGVKDPTFGGQAFGNYQLPAYDLGAHVAPLGLTFYTDNNLPGADENTLFIAEHGSWNRSSKVGYRVVKLQIRDGKVIDHQPFIEGWLQGEDHWGRPNDVIVAEDGSLLVSDDYADVIYRISAE